jgi:hypothetical protein
MVEIRQAGQVGHNLQLRWLSGQFFLSGLAMVRDHSSAEPEIGGVTPSITPRASKVILAVKPRGSEVFGGVYQQHELRGLIYPGSASEVDLTYHLGFAIDPGDLPDIVIGSSLFHFFVQMRH